ncbi:MAG: hypothetical protein GY754_04385 [bacterium]|nr:hypothetical protein [bacterium]
MSKITYTVICSNDKKHRFPVVVEVKDGTEETQSTFEAQCPFCDKYSSVTIEGELAKDVTTQRELKHYGFETNKS